MPDYKEMYLNLVRASEEAFNTLIRAQHECEEIFINCMDARDGDQARKESVGTSESVSYTHLRAHET